MKTQMRMFYEESHKIAQNCELFSDMVKDGLTREELQACILKRPAVWGKFEIWLDKLPSKVVVSTPPIEVQPDYLEVLKETCSELARSYEWMDKNKKMSPVIATQRASTIKKAREAIDRAQGYKKSYCGKNY